MKRFLLFIGILLFFVEFGFAISLSFTYTNGSASSYVTRHGSVNVGSTDVLTYTVTGSDLASDLTIAISGGSEERYALSLDNSNWSSSITIIQSSGSFTETTVYVKFSPIASGTKWVTLSHYDIPPNERDNDKYCDGTGTVQVPTISTVAMSSVQRSTASSGGTSINDNGASLSEKGTCWGTSTDPVSSGSHDADDATNTDDFSSSLVSLSEETKYYVRAYATNSEGTGYGDNVEFYSLSNEPASNPASFSASVASSSSIDLSFSEGLSSDWSGYLILQHSGSAVTDNVVDGVAYTVGQTISNDKVVAKVTSGTSTTISSLSSSTTYYYKIIPYNYDGSHDATHNYYTTSNKTANATTSTATTTWDGSSSSAWNTAANWDNGVPDANTNAVITSTGTDAIIDITTAICKDLTISSGTLTINGAKALSVKGDLDITGANALILNCTTGSSIYPASLIVDGAISGSGTTLAKLALSQAGTSESPAVRDHYISSCISDCDIANDIISIIYDGYLFSYDESTVTWSSVNSGTATVGKGYDARVWHNRMYSLDNNGAGGSLNNNTSYDLTITYSDGTAHGWNLLGNPYPAYIDWKASSGITKPAGMNNALYIKKGSVWASYVDGVGSDGGTQYISPMQGFMVKTTSSLGASGTLTIGKDALVNQTTQEYFKSTNIENENPLLRFVVASDSLSSDAVIRFKNQATTSFDNTYDALKMFPTNANIPAIYSFSSYLDTLAINTYPELFEDYTIPLGLKLGINGTYSITVTEKLNFDTLTSIYIEDELNDTIIDLNTQSTFNFTADSSNNTDRFVLHITKYTIPVIVSQSNDIEVCEGENIEMNVEGFGFPNVAYQWYNSEGIINQATTQTLNIDNTVIDDSGNYYCVVTNSKGETTSENILINIKPKPIVDLGEDIELQEDETAILDANNTGASYLWIPYHQQTQTITVDTTGTYTVMITLDGCYAEGSINVDLLTNINETLTKDINIYPNPVKSEFTITCNSYNNNSYKLYDVSGRLLKNIDFLTNSTKINMKNYENGIYILKVTSEGKEYVKQIIKE